MLFLPEQDGLGFECDMKDFLIGLLLASIIWVGYFLLNGFIQKQEREAVVVSEKERTIDFRCYRLRTKESK